MMELKIIAPVVSIPVECALDRMIARDTARRIAGALGFIPAAQAQVGSVAYHLVDLLLKTGLTHELTYNGLRAGTQIGLQITCPVRWLSDAPADRVRHSLRVWLGGLIDQADFQQGDDPALVFVKWREEDSG